jgi:hypothetical protein
MESGSENLFLQRYSEILNQCAAPPIILDKCPARPNSKSDMCTNITNMRMIIPDIELQNSQNPDYEDFVKDFGCQITTYRFYSLDAPLKNYETLFDDNKLAIIPLAYAIEYINRVKQNTNA